MERLCADSLADTAVAPDFTALRGTPDSALDKEAARLGSTLIVVGARGAGGASRILLGSVSRMLTECPTQAVAIVPEFEPAAVGDRWSIVVGVDGSDGSARALRWATEAARRGGAEVVAVHAFKSPVPDVFGTVEQSLEDETRARLEEEWCSPLRLADVAYRTVMEKGPAEVVIRSVSDSVRPECVVVGSRGRGPISQRVLGSVTHHLVRQLDWPTVVIPSARDCAVWPPHT